jgi:hypothetical protein
MGVFVNLRYFFLNLWLTFRVHCLWALSHCRVTHWTFIPVTGPTRDGTLSVRSSFSSLFIGFTLFYSAASLRYHPAIFGLYKCLIRKHTSHLVLQKLLLIYCSRVPLFMRCESGVVDWNMSSPLSLFGIMSIINISVIVFIRFRSQEIFHSPVPRISDPSCRVIYLEGSWGALVPSRSFSKVPTARFPFGFPNYLLLLCN